MAYDCNRDGHVLEPDKDPDTGEIYGYHCLLCPHRE